MSANAFASGSNQNCGNVMTGRSTTRLHGESPLPPPTSTPARGRPLAGKRDGLALESQRKIGGPAVARAHNVRCAPVALRVLIPVGVERLHGWASVAGGEMRPSVRGSLLLFS